MTSVAPFERRWKGNVPPLVAPSRAARTPGGATRVTGGCDYAGKGAQAFATVAGAREHTPVTAHSRHEEYHDDTSLLAGLRRQILPAPARGAVPIYTLSQSKRKSFQARRRVRHLSRIRRQTGSAGGRGPRAAAHGPYSLVRAGAVPGTCSSPAFDARLPCLYNDFAA